MRAVIIKHQADEHYSQETVWWSELGEDACIYIEPSSSTCTGYGVNGQRIDCAIPIRPGNRLYVTDSCELKVIPS